MGERGFSFYDQPLGKGILVSMIHFKGEQREGDKQIEEGHKDLNLEALPVSLGQRIQCAKASYCGASFRAPMVVYSDDLQEGYNGQANPLHLLYKQRPDPVLGSTERQSWECSYREV